jgi:hypothetical protein
MEEKLLSPKDLSERWRHQIGIQTLANWRALNHGPKFLKVGHRVLYRLVDVEAFETQRERGGSAL